MLIAAKPYELIICFINEHRSNSDGSALGIGTSGKGAICPRNVNEYVDGGPESASAR
jgi:hypothetical protein